MTDTHTDNGHVIEAPLPALPTSVEVTQAFASRMPTQRVIDSVERVEGGRFAEIIQHQPFRVVAFRALMRDYADRDMTSLWLHSYDVEVQIAEADPTSPAWPTLAPPSGVTGDSIPTL